jgi:hypothetical protein
MPELSITGNALRFVSIRSRTASIARQLGETLTAGDRITSEAFMDSPTIVSLLIWHNGAAVLIHIKRTDRASGRCWNPPSLR